MKGNDVSMTEKNVKQDKNNSIKPLKPIPTPPRTLKPIMLKENFSLDEERRIKKQNDK